LLTHLQLDSLYCAATWLSIPISHLFNLETQEALYSSWHKRFPMDLQGHRLAPTLDEHIAWDQAHNQNQIFYATLTDRLDKSRHIICQALKEAGHTWSARILDVIEELIIHPAIIRFLLTPLDPTGLYTQLLADRLKVGRILQGCIALTHLIFFQTPYQPHMALGWHGPDAITKKHLGKKLRVIDQSNYLFSHCAMQNPRPALFDAIYREEIWRRTKDFRFGQYHKQA